MWRHNCIPRYLFQYTVTGLKKAVILNASIGQAARCPNPPDSMTGKLFSFSLGGMLPAPPPPLELLSVDLQGIGLS